MDEEKTVIHRLYYTHYSLYSTINYSLRAIYSQYVDGVANDEGNRYDGSHDVVLLHSHNSDYLSYRHKWLLLYLSYDGSMP